MNAAWLGFHVLVIAMQAAACGAMVTCAIVRRRPMGKRCSVFEAVVWLFICGAGPWLAYLFFGVLGFLLSTGVLLVSGTVRLGRVGLLRPSRERLFLGCVASIAAALTLAARYGPVPRSLPRVQPPPPMGQTTAVIVARVWHERAFPWFGSLWSYQPAVFFSTELTLKESSALSTGGGDLSLDHGYAMLPPSWPRRTKALEGGYILVLEPEDPGNRGGVFRWRLVAAYRFDTWGTDLLRCIRSASHVDAEIVR